MCRYRNDRCVLYTFVVVAANVCASIMIPVNLLPWFVVVDMIMTLGYRPIQNLLAASLVHVHVPSLSGTTICAGAAVVAQVWMAWVGGAVVYKKTNVVRARVE